MLFSNLIKVCDELDKKADQQELAVLRHVFAELDDEDKRTLVQSAGHRSLVIPAEYQQYLAQCPYKSHAVGCDCRGMGGDSEFIRTVFSKSVN